MSNEKEKQEIRDYINTEIQKIKVILEVSSAERVANYEEMSNKFQELSDYLLALFNADGDEALELIEKFRQRKVWATIEEHKEIKKLLERMRD